MKQLLFPDYRSLSAAAARKIISHVREKPDLTLCLSTGSTPKLTYKLLADLLEGDSDCFKDCRIISIDEWLGLPERHPASCDYYLRQHVIEPLNIPESNYIWFRTNASESTEECRKVQKQLSRLGTIDLCVLGLGLNGHIAMNEPAKALSAHVHVAQLSEQTRQHSMLVSSNVRLSHGYTLGMADILSSKEIMLLVSGDTKSEPLRRFITAQIETTFPASLLWLHSAVTLYSDLQELTTNQPEEYHQRDSISP